MVKILILEDDEAIASLIKERLEEQGYQTSTAFTVSEGLAELRKERPDLITLDIYMPDSSGFDVLKIVKRDPETFLIPIVVVSSCGEKKVAEKLGAEDFIEKPIRFKKFLEIVKKCLLKIKESPAS